MTYIFLYYSNNIFEGLEYLMPWKLAVTFFATKFKDTYKQSFKSHNDFQLLLCQTK